MNESTIQHLLSRHPATKKLFKGTYAIDEIKDIKLKPKSIYIINLSKRATRGSHWVLLCTSEGNLVIYFDSSGEPMHSLELKTLLQKHPLYLFNSKLIQHPLSDCCGHFCCLFALYFAQNKTLFESRRIFSKNLEQNEKIIQEKFWTNFKRFLEV